ncbi:hypothetical protein ACFQXA_10015 [Nocardiopsis composta]
MDVASGQVLDVALSLLPDGATRLHVDLDMIAADALSLRVLMDDLRAAYQGRSSPNRTTTSRATWPTAPASTPGRASAPAPGGRGGWTRYRRPPSCPPSPAPSSRPPPAPR